MIGELLAAILKSNPEKALDLLSKTVDTVREHPPLRDAVVKWITKQAEK